MFKEIFVEMSIPEGIAFVAQGKDNPLFLNGNRLSTASGSELFVAHQNNLTCTCCGLKANTWIAYTVKNAYPVLNLYHKDETGNAILFTRDHIIPKVFGGNDSVSNLRVMCSKCNQERNCEMDEDSLNFYETNPSLILHERIQASIKRLKSGLEKYTYKATEASVVLTNFSKIINLVLNKDGFSEFSKYDTQIQEIYPLLEKAQAHEALMAKRKAEREAKKKEEASKAYHDSLLTV